MSPPTPRLFVRKAARADLAEAFRWYEQRRVGLGHEFMRVARVTLAEIARALQFHQNMLVMAHALEQVRCRLVGGHKVAEIFPHQDLH